MPTGLLCSCDGALTSDIPTQIRLLLYWRANIWLYNTSMNARLIVETAEVKETLTCLERLSLLQSRSYLQRGEEKR